MTRPARTWRMRALIVPVFVGLAAALTGCGGAGTSSPGAASPDAAIRAEPTPAAAAVAVTASGQPTADPHDPCRLLLPREVEAILGAPLAGAPFRSGAANSPSHAGVPEHGADTCWYETADYSNIAIQATWTDAGAVVAGIGGYLAQAGTAAKGHVVLQDGTDLVGDWDELRVLGCCNLIALQGDAMVEVDFGGTFLIAAQAATLADAALPRLTAPLPLSGDAGVDAALARDARRLANTDPCSLWTADDIGAVLGPLAGTPEPDDDACTWHYRNAQGRADLFVSRVQWRNGTRGYHEDNGMFGGFLAGMGADAGHPMQVRSAIPGPWDAAQDSAIQFNTVRRDLKIALRHGGMPMEQRRQLIARAYARLGLPAKEYQP